MRNRLLLLFFLARLILTLTPQNRCTGRSRKLGAAYIIRSQAPQSSSTGYLHNAADQRSKLVQVGTGMGLPTTEAPALSTFAAFKAASITIC